MLVAHSVTRVKRFVSMNFLKTTPVLLLLLICTVWSGKKLAGQQPKSKASEGFKIFFEKVYLHLDRSYYAPGEDIWFKAYLVNAQNNLFFNTSNNLYVELIDPSAAIVSRKVIRMDSTGLGDFHLGDSIAAGTYRVRAYTNWMRNFGNYFIFEKEIHVAGIPGVNNAGAGNKTVPPADNKTVTQASVKIQFLPEGGTMIEDVPTVVAFKAEDASGRGMEARGYIASMNGDTIVKFRTEHAGMGRFAFTPRAGWSYKTFVDYGNGSFVGAGLPSAVATGFVMNVTAITADSVVVSVETNMATAKLHGTGMPNIVARHAGKSYFRQEVALKNDKAVVMIPTRDFPGGIAYITLYDENMRPNAERLIYLDKELPLHVVLTPDKDFYRSREKTTIGISVTDAQNKPVKAVLSLAAVEDGAESLTSGNILSYLMLESELRGKIENPSAYFDKHNAQRLYQLDLLLRTQGWRSFLWRQIADTTIRISYLPEAGITISGNVTKPFTNKPLENMNITLFAPEAKGDKIYITKTNALGKYYLDGLPLHGLQTIKLNVGDGIGKTVGEIKMDSLFANPLPALARPAYSVDSSFMNSFEKEAAKRWTKFRSSQWPHMLPNVTVSTRVGTTLLRDGSALVNFGYPEYNFNITGKDYEYQRLRDFLVQKVPGAMYDDELEGVYFLSNGRKVRPILIVNRQQDVFGRLDYFSLAMQQVETVQVRHMVGSPTYGGINNNGNEAADPDVGILDLPPGIRDYFLIMLTVKPGNANQQLSKLTASINGYYEARLFYAPNYSKEIPDEPDERTTIHWAPLITTDENGKARISFFNADPKKKIRVNVQGLTMNGIPVVSTNTYEVK